METKVQSDTLSGVNDGVPMDVDELPSHPPMQDRMPIGTPSSAVSRAFTPNEQTSLRRNLAPAFADDPLSAEAIRLREESLEPEQKLSLELLRKQEFTHRNTIAKHTLELSQLLCDDDVRNEAIINSKTKAIQKQLDAHQRGLVATQRAISALRGDPIPESKVPETSASTLLDVQSLIKPRTKGMLKTVFEYPDDKVEYSKLKSHMVQLSHKLSSEAESDFHTPLAFIRNLKAGLSRHGALFDHLDAWEKQHMNTADSTFRATVNEIQRAALAHDHPNIDYKLQTDWLETIREHGEDINDFTTRFKHIRVLTGNIEANNESYAANLYLFNLRPESLRAAIEAKHCASLTEGKGKETTTVEWMAASAKAELAARPTLYRFPSKVVNPDSSNSRPKPSAKLLPGQHICVHCKKRASHSAADCRSNPANLPNGNESAKSGTKRTYSEAKENGNASSASAQTNKFGGKHKGKKYKPKATGDQETAKTE